MHLFVLDISLGFVALHVCYSFDHNLATVDMDLKFSRNFASLEQYVMCTILFLIHQPRLLENYLSLRLVSLFQAFILQMNYLPFKLALIGYPRMTF